MTAREGLSPNIYPHRATLEQQFPFPGHFTLNRCKHKQGLSTVSAAGHQKASHPAPQKHSTSTGQTHQYLQFPHKGDSPVALGIFLWQGSFTLKLQPGIRSTQVAKLPHFDNKQYNGRLLLIIRQQYGRQDGLQEHLLPPCSHSSVPEPGINTFTAMDSQGEKETKAKG